MTPDEHVAEAERLQAVAAAAMADGRHDMAQSAAVIAASHFTGAAAKTGIGEIRKYMASAAEVEAAPPNDTLMSFLHMVRDRTVRTVDGQVTAVKRFTFTPIARTAYAAGLAEEHAADGGPVWKLTARGREAVDRGQV